MAFRKVPLKLGLVSVGVKLDSAIRKEENSFHTVCDNQHAPVRIRQTLACPQCSNADRGSFKKATEADDGKYVVVDTKALEEATAVSDEVKNTITLSAHPADEVQFAIPGEKVYFLSPDTDPNGYALIVRLVEERRDVALCAVFAVRSKPAMYRLGVYNGALTLTEMAWPEAVNEAPAHNGIVEEKTAEMANAFLDTILEPYDPANYRDTRSEAIKELVSNTEGVTSGDEKKPATGTPTDLMTAMAAAVEAAAPKKKTARKKTAAKKTAAKKKTARKAS